MPYKCDGNSSGALIFDVHARLLLGERAQPPEGIAPPCGHVTDDDPERGHRQAAADETSEEYGLKVLPQDLELVYSRWHPNRCGAEIPADHLGHHWEVFRAARWSGEVTIAPDEVRSYGWYEPAQVQALADRTIAYAHGRLAEEEWQRSPGLEPVWVGILSTIPPPSAPERMMVSFPDPQVLGAVRDLYSTPPV